MRTRDSFCCCFQVTRSLCTTLHGSQRRSPYISIVQIRRQPETTPPDMRTCEQNEKTPVTALFEHQHRAGFEVYMPWAKLAIVNFVDHASCKASTLNKSKSSRCQSGLCRLHSLDEYLDHLEIGYTSFRHVSFQTHGSCLLRLISFYSFEDPFELTCLAYDFGPLVLGLL